ncbi:MAG: histidine phosphatase family protein [Pirellula sp.]
MTHSTNNKLPTKNKLLLMRHAKSDWADSRLADKDRPLNDRGRQAAPMMAEWLATNQLLPDRVLCSSAIRTRQTLNLMNECWLRMGTDQLLMPQVEFLDDLYLATADRILEIASTSNDGSCRLVLGHNPGMEQLASSLGDREIDMPTAAIVALESCVPGWPDDWSDKSQWSLRGLVKPRDLASLQG